MKSLDQCSSNFEDEFYQMVQSCPRRSIVESINLIRVNCKTQPHHKNTLIFGFCMNQNCFAPSRLLCERCIAEGWHYDDIDFNMDDILFGEQVDRIIQRYRDKKQEGLERIKIHILLLQLYARQYFSDDDFRCKDIVSLNQKYLDCINQLENLTIINYIETVQYDNISLCQYLIEMNRSIIELENDIHKIQKSKLVVPNDAQGINGDEGRKKKTFDLVTQIIQSSVYQRGEMDQEQTKFIESQVEIQLQCAMDYAKSKIYDQALDICETMIVHSKQKSIAHLNKGIILDKLGEFEEALKDLKH